MIWVITSWPISTNGVECFTYYEDGIIVTYWWFATRNQVISTEPIFLGHTKPR